MKARKLIVVGLIMLNVILIAAMAFLGHRVFSSGDESESASILGCNSDADCRGSMRCRGGFCADANARSKAFCAVGGECGLDCLCEQSKNLCQRDPRGGPSRCLPRPAASPETCESAELQTLRSFLAACKSTQNGSCDFQTLDRARMEPEQLDRLLEAFPTRVAVHYRDWTPPVDGKSWPDEDVARDHYERTLAQHLDGFETARTIVVVGRSSKGGDESRNARLSVKRMNHAGTTLREVMAKARSFDAARAAEFGSRFVYVTLGNAVPLSSDFYRRNFSTSVVAWSPKAQANLQNWVDQNLPDDPGAIAVINQVSILIGLPCDLEAPSR